MNHEVQVSQKKTYEAPKLTVHGSVESLTQVSEVPGNGSGIVVIAN